MPDFNLSPAQLRRIANILETNSDQPGFDFYSALAAMEAEDRSADNPDSVKLRLARDLADAVAQRAAGAHPATYLLGRLNEPGISWDDDWNLTAWDYDPTDPQKHIVVTEADLAPADSEPATHSGKPTVSDATRAAFLLAADAMNRFGLLAHADPGVKPELAAKINNWQQDLSSCDWPILGYDTSDPPATGSVKTWTYSQVNPGGADITHGFTFTGTDDEFAEHIAELTYQGIEPYNAKVTAPVTALGTDFPATPEGFRAAQAAADHMADEENKRIAAQQDARAVADSHAEVE